MIYQLYRICSIAVFISFQSLNDAKLQNNADIRKRFWKINAVRPINKDNSGKNEESLKVGTKQIYAVR